MHVSAGHLEHDVPVQVLDIELVGRSRGEQLEALVAGEVMKGREVIRVVRDGEETAGAAADQSVGGPGSRRDAAGPYKLLLQDRTGKCAYAFEVRSVDKIGFPPVLSIGGKLMLKRGCLVARGMLLLAPETVTVLGGRLEALERAWKEGRVQRLKDALEKESGPSVVAEEG